MANNTSIVDELLSRLDIVDVIWKYVPLKRAGANFSGCCPFHNEKTPSFMVSPQKQIFKCFGCWVGGNVFTFIQEIEKIDFWDAVKLLAEQERIDISQYQSSSAYQQYSQDEKEKMKRMHKLAQDFFVESLKHTEPAIEYLKQERMLNDTIITEFWIGYAPDKSFELLQYLRGKWFNDEDLIQASLAKKNMNGEVYSFFRNRITFPIYDIMKNVVGFTARVIDPEDQPKYLNSAEHKAFEKSKILYGLSHAKAHLNQFQKLIIVEWQMDVIGLSRLWFPIGIATSGTALTEEHIKLLKRYTENLFLLFDNDKAWQQAAFRALKLCYNQDIFPKVISLPDGYKDVDDLANIEEGKQLFESALNEAQDWFIAMFDRFRTNSDMSSPIDKQKLINAMFELIVSVKDDAIQKDFSRFTPLVKLWQEIFHTSDVTIIQKEITKKRESNKILLKQQARQAEQEKPDHYQPNRELLFSSLFYQDFLSKLIEHCTFLESLSSFAMQIAVAAPESYLARVFKGDLLEREIEEINEIQLWWEKELGEVEDQVTKRAILQRVIWPNIQEYFKMGSKSAHLSNEEKMQLNKLRIEIGRK